MHHSRSVSELPSRQKAQISTDKPMGAVESANNQRSMQWTPPASLRRNERHLQSTGTVTWFAQEDRHYCHIAVHRKVTENV